MCQHRKCRHSDEEVPFGWITQLEEKNESVNSVLGNYLIELELGKYQAKESSSTSDT